MKSRSRIFDPKAMTFAMCDECRIVFVELHSVAVGKAADPDDRLLCIGCDPAASEPALTHVTPAGWVQRLGKCG